MHSNSLYMRPYKYKPIMRLCHGIHNPRDISIAGLHLQSRLNTPQQRRELQLLGLMYDIKDHEPYFHVPLVQTQQAEMITFDTDIVQYDIYKRSPYYVGSKLWNNLPAETQRLESIERNLKLQSNVSTLARIDPW